MTESDNFFPISNTVVDLCIMNEESMATVFCIATSAPLVSIFLFNHPILLIHYLIFSDLFNQDSIQVWEIRHDKKNHFLLGSFNVQSRVTAIKYHRINQNSGKILSTHQDGTLTIFDVSYDNEKAKIQINSQFECHKGPATSLDISRKFEIITVGEDGHLWCGDLKTGKIIINSLKISESPLHSISFSDDDTFITASHSKLITMWDLKSSFKNTCTPTAHFEEEFDNQKPNTYRYVWSLDCHPAQPFFISSTSSNNNQRPCIMVHDSRLNQPYPIYQWNDIYSTNIWKVRYNKDDPNFIISCSDDCTLSKLYFLTTEEQRLRPGPQKEIIQQYIFPISCFDIDYTNNLILSASEDEMLSITPLNYI